MKKTSLFALAIGAIALASCSKEIAKTEQQPVANGTPFSIFASTPDTKTAVNDGQKGVDWVENDAMNVFHAVAGSTTYLSEGEFVLSEGTKFEGTVSKELAANNDWYAIYPYKDQISTPAATSGGWQYIGSRSDKSQIQSGNNSMTHLAGDNFPLYGVCKNVAQGETPSFEMKQLSSIVAVKVTNKTSEPLTVKSVSFTGTENIVGTFYVDFTGANPSFTDATYAGSTANLTVNNATALNKDAFATYYLAVKPFSATYGQKLTVAVNGYEKDIDLTKDVTFAPGKIKTINFNYNNVVSSVTWDLSTDQTVTATEDEMTWTSDVADMAATKGSSSINTNNYYPGTPSKTYTSTRFYSGSTLAITPRAGITITKVVFSATTATYANALSGSTWSNASASASETTVTVTPTDGTLAISAAIGGTTGHTGVQVFYTGTPKAPYATITIDDTLELESDECDGTLEPEYTNTEYVDVAVFANSNKTGECDWLEASVNANGRDIDYLAMENTSDENRTAYIVIYAMNAEAHITEKVITVTQVGIGGKEQVYKVAKFGSAATSGTSTSYTTTWTSVTNGFSVSVDNGNTNGTSWAMVKFGRKNYTSVGSITTSAAIDKAVTKIVVDIDAITANLVNSITLYSGNSDNSCTTSEGTFTVAAGKQTVSISSPAANKYYKVEFNCKSGSANGFVAVKTVEYYAVY